ncbi:MAG: D-amino-acid transaminase [Pseudomonadota bacterium]
MSRIAYVNGRYVPHADAQVHIEDRGYQFADGIYEVAVVIGGQYWDLEGHLARMQRSLAALSMAAPLNRGPLKVVMGEMVRRNRLKDALVYIQATRGVAPRNHPFPNPSVTPALIMTAKKFDLDGSDNTAQRGISVITQPDIRWGRVDVKSVSLLPNVLAKQAAVEAGAGEAWLVRDGKVTEGSATNAWIVDPSGVLITHPKTNEILGGITRETTLACARDLQMKVEERAFTVDEVKSAREAFITSATNLVMPVISIDGHSIGDAKPGDATLSLREAYKLRAREG